MKARINSVALVGWRGIKYLEVQLDDGPLTGLIGYPGAGKSTIAMCTCYALLPDRRALEIAPISDVSDPHQVGIDTLGARIDPDVGYAYVLLDVRDAQGSRRIAGIHARSTDGRAEFTRLKIETPPEDWTLQDFLRVVDGESETYPDHGPLVASLAARGVLMRECKTVREYGEFLYSAGILPCDLSDVGDRALYARLIESAFRGGLTKEVVSQLKEYLLPPAARIPESLERLQKCADTMMRTRSALSTAKEQLHLLQSTFGLGKAIVARALAHIRWQLTDAVDRETKAKSDIANQRAALTAIEQALVGIGQSKEAAEATKKGIESAFESELAQCAVAQTHWATKKIQLQTALREATTALETFNTGRRTWEKLTKTHPQCLTVDQLEAALNVQEEAAARRAMELELEHARILQRRETLAAGASESSSAALAEALGAQSLEEALDDVPEADARAIEMALSGLVEGVTSADLDSLAKLPDHVDYPHTFWLRTKAPEPTEVMKIGDWYAATAPGGFLITSSRRRLTLGRHARQAEIGRLDAELRVLSQAVGKERDKQRQAKALRDGLIEHRLVIEFYLNSAHKETEWRSNVEAARAAVEEANTEFDKATSRHGKILQDRRSKTEEIERQLIALDRQKNEALSRQREHGDALKLAKEQMDGAVAHIADWSAQQRAAEAELGEDFEWLAQSAGEPLSRETYIAEQASQLAALGHALATEQPDRMQWHLQAKPSDASSCCRTWAPLKAIVSERVSVDALDKDGSDLLSSMAARRHALEAELETQQLELRSEAKSLYSVITTEIRKQERRVKALSQFGETLNFGNVNGMRIRTEQRKDLLEKLHSITDQMDFFAGQATVGIETQLADLFEKTLGIKIAKGTSLLDYRTYLDLFIEVHRGKWGPAAGLSGGESIGGGLAVALMLSKSLAQRGAEGRPRDFTPFFVVDEVQRLNGEGQGVIVQFGQQQGMQILVTALNLEATYDCTTHVLSRIFTPEETIVSRRVKVRASAGPRAA